MVLFKKELSMNFNTFQVFILGTKINGLLRIDPVIDAS